MIVESAIVLKLQATGGVTDLVPAERIYRHTIDQEDDATPVVRVQQLGGSLTYHLGGEADAGVARVQVDVWADKPSEAEAVARAIRSALSGLTSEAGGVTFRSCQLDNVVSLTDPPEASEGMGGPRVMLEFGVRFDAD